MQTQSETAAWYSNRWTWVSAILVLVVLGTVYFATRPKAETSAIVFVARRGPLDITVAEGGSVQALESQESRSEVKGYQGTKILRIVEEGYLVTAEDVKNEKVLVELDSSEIKNKIVQQDIQFESTAASLIDAQQAYEIQVNQNLSDVMAAEQKAKFARMDFEKFMGSSAAAEIIEKLGLDRPQLPPPSTNAGQSLAGTVPPGGIPTSATASGPAMPQVMALAKGSPTLVADATQVKEVRSDSQAADVAAVVVNRAVGEVISAAVTNTPTTGTNGSATLGTEADLSTPKSITFDFRQYAKPELLGDGEAKQKIRKFDDDCQVAEKERLLAQSTYEGTKRLFDKEFATRTELDNDELKLQNAKLKVQTAETARALFLNYEFPKTAEETLSKYAEAARELDRARKSAISKLAQAEAKLKSAQGRYNLESQQRKELEEQLANCFIKAKRQGLVVYGGGNEEGFYYGQEPIREGATVRERQAIITIPDTTKMAVKVKIHESYIKKVTKGQKAKITVDAFPDKLLEGEVITVGVLPDSQNRWMNPDLKVYLTTIRVDGAHDWLKPGMSAKVEIMVKRLPDVVYIPLQAVAPDQGQHVCYVMNGRKQERRIVEVGDFSDEFIEIKKGIKEGERVCLRAPSSSEPDQPQEEEPSQEQTGQPSGGSTPVAAAASAG